MSKYSFEKGSTVEVYVPLSYAVDFTGENDSLSIVSNMFSNTTYSVCDWSINITHADDADMMKCTLRKHIRQNEIGVMSVQLLPIQNDGERMPSIQLKYTRKNRLYDDKEIIVVPFTRAVIMINSAGIIETSEADSGATVLSRSNLYNGVSQQFQSDTHEISGIPNGRMEAIETQKLKKKYQDLEAGIQSMNKEIEQLQTQIKLRETEYRKMENEIYKKKMELQQKIEDLNKLQENGELDIKKIQEDYEERCKELQLRYGDTRFAMEKLLQQRKRDYTVQGLFDQVDADLKKLDDMLIQMARENEEESKDLAAAIFNNDGKVVV